MGNWLSYTYHGQREDDFEVNANNIVAKIPNHLLIDVMNCGLTENDISAFRSVCKRWNWLVSVTPNDRLPKFHVFRLGIDSRLEGDDVIWVKQRNYPNVTFIRGSTRDGTIRKLKRISCDELRLCGGHQHQMISRGNAGHTDPSFFHVAINPALFTTILQSSLRTLTRVYIFRCSLFRFNEKDMAALAGVDNLQVLCICHVSDANAVNDHSLTPIVARGTLEQLVIDRTTITNRLLFTIGQHCKKLALLSVSGCPAVTDMGIRAVLAGSSNEHGSKVICRQTEFDYMRFLNEWPQFRLSASGRALELPQKKMAVYFV